jgi:hypothetical protein
MLHPCPAGLLSSGSGGAASRNPWCFLPAAAAACRSFYRCLTIHATSNLLVQNNVAFDTTGHCFYLEVGAGAGCLAGGGRVLSIDGSCVPAGPPTCQRGSKPCPALPHRLNSTTCTAAAAAAAAARCRMEWRSTTPWITTWRHLCTSSAMCDSWRASTAPAQPCSCVPKPAVEAPCCPNPEPNSCLMLSCSPLPPACLPCSPPRATTRLGRPLKRAPA